MENVPLNPQGAFDAVLGETYHIQVTAQAAATFQILLIQPYTITVQGGQNYFIRLSGVGFQYQIEGTFAGEPPNDNLANAQLISIPTYAYENGQEGFTTWEGNLAGAAIQTNGNAGQYGVWYEIQPQFQGELQILSDDSVYSLIYAAPNPNYTAGGSGVFLGPPRPQRLRSTRAPRSAPTPT